ncbi:MAG: ZIP family metal transporter [Candidatus Micrarchaeia archaeon]
MQELLNVLLLSLAAGLATGLGGALAVLRTPGKKSMGVTLGFAAGIMLGLAFLELIPEARALGGFTVAVTGFAVGAAIMLLLDAGLPHIRFRVKEESVFDIKLYKTSLLIAIGIALHNLPEGIAVGAGYAHAPSFGLMVAAIIALHNIPEGMIIAMPCCASGSSKRKSFKLALLSGLAEPFGAVLAFVLLDTVRGAVPFALAFAAGVMTFITLDELLPCAHAQGHSHLTGIGLIGGVTAAMALTAFFA